LPRHAADTKSRDARRSQDFKAAYAGLPDGDRPAPRDEMNFLDLLQWPAMVITVAASWLVASNQQRRRNVGFWLFLLSNAAWVVWGLGESAYALVVLQFCLAFMNIRGARKTQPADGASTSPGATR
jgi:hypothetical protein